MLRTAWPWSVVGSQAVVIVRRKWGSTLSGTAGGRRTRALIPRAPVAMVVAIARAGLSGRHFPDAPDAPAFRRCPVGATQVHVVESSADRREMHHIPFTPP